MLGKLRVKDEQKNKCVPAAKDNLVSHKCLMRNTANRLILKPIRNLLISPVISVSTIKLKTFYTLDKQQISFGKEEGEG